MTLTARDELLPMLGALHASDLALQRDECGDYRISGSRGWIYPWGDAGGSWWVYVRSHSVRAWSAAKTKLVFCHSTQDGDDEGAFRLVGLPTAEQADVIRAALGIRKRRDVSPEEIDRLRRFGFSPRQKPASASPLR